MKFKEDSPIKKVCEEATQKVKKWPKWKRQARVTKFSRGVEMKLKERLAIRAAEKLVKKMKKEDLLIPLGDAIRKQGLAVKENEVDAAMERIEKSGMKSIFGKLGITREDIEKVFKS